jgi:hypothetical protein
MLPAADLIPSSIDRTIPIRRYESRLSVATP